MTDKTSTSNAYSSKTALKTNAGATAAAVDIIRLHVVQGMTLLNKKF